MAKIILVYFLIISFPDILVTLKDYFIIITTKLIAIIIIKAIIFKLNPRIMVIIIIN
jgi:hypothetical protein